MKPVPKSAIMRAIGSKFRVVHATNRLIVLLGKPSDIDEVSRLLASADMEPKRNTQSAATAHDSIIVGSFEIAMTPPNVRYRVASGLGASNNPSIINRLAFGHYIHQTTQMVAKPYNVHFQGSGKIVRFSAVHALKFLGEGIADLRLVTTGGNIPLSINRMEGVYHTTIDDRSTMDVAHDALVTAAESGLLNATMHAGDRMELHQPVVMKAPVGAIRKLIFNQIRNGLGIVGEFKPANFEWAGRTNTLKVKCDRLFQTATDLKSDDEPYLIITNTPNRRLFDLKDLTVDLIPKRGIPRNATMINN